MKKFIIIGQDPRKIGGVETYSRLLNSLVFNCKSIFLCEYSREDDATYNVDNVICLFDYKLLPRIFNKISNGYFFNLFFKFKLKKLSEYTAIINNSKYISLFREDEEFFINQHCHPSRIFNGSASYAEYNKFILNVLSPYDKEYVVEEFGLCSNRINVIRPCTQLKKIRKTKKIGNKLLMLTRLDNNTKRLDLVISAMKKLPRLELHIYGDGPDRKFIEGMVSNVDNIFLHESTNNTGDVIDSCNIMINSSDHEGYPMTLIEAQRRGLPVITRSTYPSSRDIVDGNGVLLGEKWNEDEFVLAVNNCMENYAEYSSNSIANSDKYNTETFSKAWKKILRH
ncbi:glycosyltransferase [Vibrio owensii]|uniref:glycosyltransferase n=1 Tax=Vibrio owensii TaxID=696485 RepID=UPI0005F07AD8|nr:glycosyltransferase [Vibrio owensii]